MRLIRTASFALALSVCSVLSSSAGEWDSVDYLADAFPTAVVSINGDVFVTGDVDLGNGSIMAVISKSTDQGDSWYDLTFPDTPTFEAAAVRTIGGGAVPVEHHLVLSGGGQIRRSLNAGVTWEIVDQLPGGMAVRSITIDSAGNIYVAGSASKLFTIGTGKKTTRESRSYWVVRRIARDAELGAGDEGKSTFHLDDTARGGNTWPTEAICDGSSVIIAGRSGGYWHVRRSDDQGQSWALLDDHQEHVGYTSVAEALTVDSQSNLWVVGYGLRPPIGKGRSAFNPSSWLVRKGTPNGNGTYTFTTINTFEIQPSSWTAARGILIDGSGNVNVTGDAVSDGEYRWVTRTLPTGSSTWASRDNAPGFTTTRIASDLSGNLYVAGCAPENGWLWTVRRQLAD